MTAFPAAPLVALAPSGPALVSLSGGLLSPVSPHINVLVPPLIPHLSLHLFSPHDATCNLIPIPSHDLFVLFRFHRSCVTAETNPLALAYLFDTLLDTVLDSLRHALAPA